MATNSSKLAGSTWLRHGIVLLVSFALIGGFLARKGFHAVNLASADASVVLIALSLMIGPLARLWSKGFKSLLLFRREIGIWGGIAGLVHMVLLANTKLGWNPLKWFMTVGTDGSYTLSLMGENMGNLIGLVAALFLLVLVLTSNDWSQKKLGAGPWKFVQQTTYIAFVLVALHSMVFLYKGGHDGGMDMRGAALPAADVAQTGESAPAGTRPQDVKPAKMQQQAGTAPADGSGLMMPPREGEGGSNLFRSIFWVVTLGAAGLQTAGFFATVAKVSRRNQPLAER